MVAEYVTVRARVWVREGLANMRVVAPAKSGGIMRLSERVDAIEKALPLGEERGYVKYHDLWRAENGVFIKTYTHIERMGHEDLEGILDGHVIVQDKMDGANLSVAVVSKRIVIGSRNQAIYISEIDNPHEATGFNGAIEYILNH